MGGAVMARDMAGEAAGLGTFPGAFIAGAPKCGTTALAHYLARHPGVAVSEPKEPGYLATDLPGLAVVQSEADYLALFATPGAALRIDASIWYLYSETAIANILARRPDARFIVMLRNPVKMIPSLHRQLLNVLDEDEADLAAAWRLSAARAEGRHLPPRCRAPKTLLYTETAAFGAQLERLFARVPREAVLVLFQEELQRDPRALYARVLAFLGLPDDGRTSFEIVNEAASFRHAGLQSLIKRDHPALHGLARPLKAALGLKSLGFRRALDRLNRRRPEAGAPAPALAAEIAAHYRDDMRRLATLLGRDLGAEFGWPL